MAMIHSQKTRVYKYVSNVHLEERLNHPKRG